MEADEPRVVEKPAPTSWVDAWKQDGSEAKPQQTVKRQPKDVYFQVRAAEAVQFVWHA